MKSDRENTGLGSLICLDNLTIFIGGNSEHKMPIKDDVILVVCTGSFNISRMIVGEIILFLINLVYKPSILLSYIPRGSKHQVVLLFIICLIDIFLPCFIGFLISKRSFR